MPSVILGFFSSCFRVMVVENLWFALIATYLRLFFFENFEVGCGPTKYIQVKADMIMS